MKSLLEIRKEKIKEEKDWEVAWNELYSYFRKEPSEECGSHCYSLSENFYGCFLIDYVEECLGIPRKLRGKGLVGFSKTVFKEIELRIPEKKENILESMSKEDILDAASELKELIGTPTPGYYEELLKLKRSDIFPTMVW